MIDASFPVVRLEDVRVWTAEGAHLLKGIDWTVLRGEHWAILGPNGAGKSTLLSVVAASRFPSSGSVELLGGRLGYVEIRRLRQQIGIVDPSIRLLDWMTVEEIVLTGATGTIRLVPDAYGPLDLQRAEELIELLGLTSMAQREIRTCSQGERQRVRLARAMMPAPKLLLLDEPASGLDLPAREALIAALTALAHNEPQLTTLLISHHLEELPTTTSHALLIRSGAVMQTGPADDVLTERYISDCFGIPVEVGRVAGRWHARASAAWKPGDLTQSAEGVATAALGE